MRIKLVIEYDGTDYAGWQRQTNGVSVQQVVEEALKALTGEQITLHASGRTDAGVHALGQTAHFDTKTTIPAEKISFALNMHLPADIKAVESVKAADDFHARYSALAKTYLYTYINRDHPSALFRNTCAHIRANVDIGAMKKAAEALLGTHDFASFCASGSEAGTTVRTIYRIDIKQEQPFIRLEVTGNGFLYNMVRIIAGTLLDAGMHRLSLNEVMQILAAKDRTKASPTAPAKGLTLKKVYYEQTDFLS